MPPDPDSQRFRRRPLGVTVIALIQLLTSVAIFLALILDGSVSMPLVSTDDEPIAAAIAAVITLVLAVGLWFLQRWAWIGVMLWQGAVLATALFGYVHGQKPLAEMAVSVVVVFYLNQSEVESAFRRPREDAEAAA